MSKIENCYDCSIEIEGKEIFYCKICEETLLCKKCYYKNEDNSCQDCWDDVDEEQV